MQIQYERIFYTRRVLDRKSGHAKRKLEWSKGDGEKGGNQQVEREKEKKRRKERAKLGRLCLSGRHRIARRIKNLSKKYSHCKSSHLQSTPTRPQFSTVATFPRQGSGTGRRREAKDNTMKTSGSPQWSTRDDTLREDTSAIARNGLRLTKQLCFSIFAENRSSSFLLC